VLDATVQGLPVIVIVNHLRSLNGVDAQTDAGGRVRLKRQKQAESLAALVQSFQAANPAANIIVVGDFNAFQFNDGYVDVIGTIKGAPVPADQVQIGTSVDLVNPDLTNLVETLPSPGQRYSYLFGGDAQVLDHVLVNSNMAARAVRLAYARGNADAPETARNDANTAFRISDHDAPVAYFTLPPPVVNINAQTSITTTGLLYSRLTRTYNGSVTVTNTSGVTINGPVNLVYRNLPAGVTLANATGNYEGAPSRLVTAGSLAPGQSITVSVSFNNPANVPITYTIDRIAGTF
jgi:hypothetical protein